MAMGKWPSYENGHFRKRQKINNKSPDSSFWGGALGKRILSSSHVRPRDKTCAASASVHERNKGNEATGVAGALELGGHCETSDTEMHGLSPCVSRFLLI
jgi:hypothetical protein